MPLQEEMQRKITHPPNNLATNPINLTFWSIHPSQSTTQTLQPEPLTYQNYPNAAHPSGIHPKPLKTARPPIRLPARLPVNLPVGLPESQSATAVCCFCASVFDVSVSLYCACLITSLSVSPNVLPTTSQFVFSRVVACTSDMLTWIHHVLHVCSFTESVAAERDDWCRNVFRSADQLI